MSAEKSVSIWPDQKFWLQFESLETRHRRAQSEHESVCRDLEVRRRARSDELAEVWDRYCKVIAELDRSAAEIESFRAQGIS